MRAQGVVESEGESQSIRGQGIRARQGGSWSGRLRGLWVRVLGSEDEGSGKGRA